MGGIYGHDVATLPLGWLTALATSDLRLAVYSWRAVYGIARFLHLLGMAGFVGTAAIMDLRGFGLFAPAALDAARPGLIRVLTTCFWVAIATGALLFLRDPIGAGLHTMFLPKLLVIGFGYAFSRWGRPRLPGKRLRQGGAGLSLAVWILVIGASTWNHVERPARVTDALRYHTLGK